MCCKRFIRRRRRVARNNEKTSLWETPYQLVIYQSYY
ncbi:unnamed protein product [Brassica oleracea var. botrytis]